ncbi:MAG: NAD(P)/FAD-dependent oxidoreductase [Candidatus Muiribacteriota bacterium]
MKYNYDVLVIGLGPAGMAVSAMAAEMGLKVAAIEKRRIGGECMNVGCIPSKALLRYSKNVKIADKISNSKISSENSIFPAIQKDLDFIHDKKMEKMLDKVEIFYESAEFVNKHTVRAGENLLTSKRIYIATGTSPFIPPIPGIESVKVHTNENIFNLEKIPSSMVIIGGGAIGCEMAQAFSRLGTKVSLVHTDPNLIHGSQKNKASILEEVFKEEGIIVKNSTKITKVEKSENLINVITENDEILTGEILLVAAGRTFDGKNLKLDNAGIKYSSKGISVNKYLQTNIKNIYAPGDSNGYYLLSHAAMHQGMIALMNSMLPFFAKKNFKNYVIPWTVFTDPQISVVGKSQYELEKSGIKYEIVKTNYSDYGAAIAEKIDNGEIEVYVSSFGKIYGARIIGEGSGEMINEFAMAIQYNIKLYNILFLQHSFPTMSFMIKRISEIWMMKKMESKFLKKMCKLFF